MPFGAPPSAPATPPPAPPSPAKMTLAQTSAMGTTAGAPVMQTSKGPPNGSGLPGSGPPPAAPGMNQQPQGVNTSPPAGAAPARPVVGPHTTQSVGTHPSRSPNKRVNPAHGMAQ